jgi:hypothetical protein
MAASAPGRSFDMAVTASGVVMATVCVEADTPMEFAGAIAVTDQERGLRPSFFVAVDAFRQ